ncbi:MAG TPA: hypothetical protein V6C97_15855 [Oculatellaceae cyanobacterium]
MESGKSSSAFDMFGTMPTVLIELSLSFINLPDLLKASRACKVMKESAEQVLGQVTDLSSLAFFPSLFALLMRLPGLQTISSSTISSTLLDQLSSTLTMEQRITLHQHLPHLQESLFSESDWQLLPRPLDPRLCPSLRSLDDPVSRLPDEVLEWLDVNCPHLDDVTLSDVDSVQPHLLNIVSRCRSLTLPFEVPDFDASTRLLLSSVRSLTSLSCKFMVHAYVVLSCLGVDNLSRTLTTIDIICYGEPQCLDLILSVEWPLLRRFHCYFLQGPSDALDLLVSQMPALTDLRFDMRSLAMNRAHADSFRLSSASVARLASQLRSLSLSDIDIRVVDLLSTLSSSHLESLSLDLRVEYSPPSLLQLQQVLSKMDHLTTVNVFDAKHVDGTKFVVAGLAARSDQCNAQIRALGVSGDLSTDSEKMLVELVLRVRPILEVFDVLLPVASAFLVLEAQKEERKKGSGRLLLYHFHN